MTVCMWNGIILCILESHNDQCFTTGPYLCHILYATSHSHHIVQILIVICEQLSVPLDISRSEEKFPTFVIISEPCYL